MRFVLPLLALPLLVGSAAAGPAAPRHPDPAPAPFPYTVSAVLPQVPDTLPLYAVVAPDTDAEIEQLRDVFGLTGRVQFDEDFGGTQNLRDGDVHAYAWGNGGMAYHDVANGLHEIPIRPVDKDTLWSTSEALLDDLGLFEDPIVQLAPLETGEMVNELHEHGGPVSNRWVSAQGATWGMTVDGWPAFGGGAKVTVLFGDQGMIIGLDSGMRTLEPAGEAHLAPPAQALRGWLRTANETGHWSVLKAATPNLQSVDIDDVTLGYFVSDTAQLDPVVVPVYAIHGVVTYAPAPGQTATTDLLWYQPAAPGLSIPDFGIATSTR